MTALATCLHRTSTVVCMDCWREYELQLQQARTNEARYRAALVMVLGHLHSRRAGAAFEDTITVIEQALDPDQSPA